MRALKTMNMSKSPDRSFMYEIPRELIELKNVMCGGESELAQATTSSGMTDAERQAHDDVHRQRVDAHREAALRRASSRRSESDIFSVEINPTKRNEIDDIKVKHGNADVSLKEIFGAEKVKLKMNGREKRGEVIVPGEMNNAFEKLNVVLRIITARVMTKDPYDMNDREKKIYAMYQELDKYHKAVCDARADKEMSFEDKVELILDAEKQYLAKLKDIPNALLEEFQEASESLHDKSKSDDSEGVYLETVLGLRENEVEEYLKKLIWLQSMDAIAPYELTQQGYKNKATGEIENPSIVSRDGLEQRVKMYMRTTELGQELEVRKRIGGHKAKVAARTAMHINYATVVSGLIVGATVGLVARSLWRTFFEWPTYHLSGFIGKTVDKWMKKLHVPFAESLKTDTKREPPWKKRGDKPIIGPALKLWGALATGKKMESRDSRGKK
jgi:hypothetical protein